ncbi:MAG: hypothetical protein QOF48_1170 [Verrucomicrobiota bacterium]
MVLVTTAVLAFVSIAYMRLTFCQNSFTARSQAWNNCLPIVEAGLEDALGQVTAHTNYNYAANGYTGTSKLFTKTAAMGEGYYTVTVNFSNVISPIITCTGYLPAPLTLASAASGPLLATAFTPDPSIKYISRTVRVTLQQDLAFPKALVAKGFVNFNGNNVLMDSYNSNIGMYTALTAGDKGDVTINGDFKNAGNIGNADIKGHVSLGPKTTLSVGPNGCIGSVAWHLSPGKGIQSGWTRKDSNVTLPDVAAPWSGGALPPTGNGGWKYILDGGNFEINTLNLGSTEKMRVKSDSVIYVTGNINISGDVSVDNGVKLTVYCGGSQCSLQGTYTKSDIPAEFLLYGLPSLKTITASGFAAAIYAPNAAMTLNGNNQFYGSAVVNSMTISGNSGFHYDEALATKPGSGYLIASWNEI